MNTAPIEFYFDFSSPYGYMAAQKIDALAARHGRTVDWRPILLGVIFRATGGMPLPDVPLKGPYSKRDFARSARFHGIMDFHLPSVFPIPSQAPSRIVLWAKQAGPAAGAAMAKALYRAYFVDDRDISSPDIASEVAGAAGFDAVAARAAVDDPVMKDALRHSVESALKAGVFGSPFVVVDGEPFWGLDRFDQIERWVSTGGF